MLACLSHKNDKTISKDQRRVLTAQISHEPRYDFEYLDKVSNELRKLSPRVYFKGLPSNKVIITFDEEDINRLGLTMKNLLLEVSNEVLSEGILLKINNASLELSHICSGYDFKSELETLPRLKLSSETDSTNLASVARIYFIQDENHRPIINASGERVLQFSVSCNDEGVENKVRQSLETIFIKKKLEVEVFAEN
jgi:hypothetical protein